MDDRYYLGQCFRIAEHSPCQKMRFGAALVPYGGGFAVLGVNSWYPEGVFDYPRPCPECLRQGVPSGTRGELCRAVHAEQVVLLRALKGRMPTHGATVYVAGTYPDGQRYLKLDKGFYCTLCARTMLAVGIERVVVPKCKGNGWEPASLTMEEVWAYAYGVAAGDIGLYADGKKPGADQPPPTLDNKVARIARRVSDRRSP